MKKTATAPNEIFNEAMDWFFGFNPVNPYWFLFVLYLRKKHLLSIENNYPGDSVNALTPFNEPTYWRDVVGYKFPGGILWQTVVGKIEGNQRLIDIYREFERASESRKQATLKTPFNLASLYQWEDSFLLETVSKLLSIDDEWFDNNFNDCFNKALRRIYAKERFELFTQPEELTYLIGKLMGDDIKIIYNPFAGVANFSLLTPHTAQYMGEEIVPIIAAIANLRILANDINGEVKIEDSTNALDYSSDIIVSNPPMRYRIDKPQIAKLFGGQNDADTLLLRKCAMNNIRGIIIVPMAVSYGIDYTKRVREMLVERDCVDMVIELPSNILDGTGVLTAIYVINLHHSHKGHIRIINATDCFTEDKHKRVLNVSEVITLIETQNSPNNLLVDAEIIAQNEFSFAFSRYAQQSNELPDGTPLIPISDLGEIWNNRTPSKIQHGKFANFSMLSNPNKLKIFSAVDFEERELPNPSCQITKDCVIVQSARGLRASCVHAVEENPLYIPASYFCFIPNENIILPQYFVLQIRSEYIQKLLGDNSPRRSDFLAMKLAVPSLEEQRHAIEEYQAELVRELGMEVDSLKTQRFNEYERNMHLRKHHLKHVLSEVVPAAQLLAHFISSQDGTFSKDTIIARRSNSSLESYANKLLQNTKKIQSLISALTDEETFGEPEVIDIVDFIKEYKSRKFVDKYELVFLCESTIRYILDETVTEQTTYPTAFIAKSNFETLFDNIIANAEQHGFTDKNRKDYAIRVSFSSIIESGKDMLMISIANNGEKLPVGMTPDRIFSWGVGSGTGLGSWQTKNIVEHFGGSIEFIQYDDEADGFNIEYRIILPMTK